MTDINLVGVTQRASIDIETTDKLPIWPVTVDASNDLQYVTIDQLASYADTTISNDKYVKVSLLNAPGDLYVATDNDEVSTLSVIAGDGIPLVIDSTASTNMKWGQVASAGIATNAVVTSKIYDLAVTTDKINDLAVTNGKLAAGAVTADKIASGAVSSSAIAGVNRTTVSPSTIKLYVNDVLQTSTYTKTGTYTHIGNEVFGTVSVYFEDISGNGELRIEINARGINPSTANSNLVPCGVGYFERAAITDSKFPVMVLARNNGLDTNINFMFRAMNYYPNGTNSTSNAWTTNLFGSNFSINENDYIVFDFRYQTYGF